MAALPGPGRKGAPLSMRQRDPSVANSRPGQLAMAPPAAIESPFEIIRNAAVQRSPAAAEIPITSCPRATSVDILSESRLIREALSLRLNAEENIHVARAEPYSHDVLNLMCSDPPDILLVDSEFLGRAGFKAIADAHLRMPTAKIVLIDMAGDRDTFLESARVGISAYLLRDASADEVLAAIQCVAKGEAVCPPRLCTLLFSCMSRQCMRIPGLFGKLNFGLTRREQQVIQLMSCGLSNKEISSEMHLSDQTIKRHVHQILHKVGAGDRTTAVELCRLHAMCP